MEGSNDGFKENKELIEKAREDRAAILKEAKEAKDLIINEAKKVAKQEARKIIEDAAKQIDATKRSAMEEIETANSNTIIREIEFPPNLVEAGLSFLNHFSSIINHKYSGLNIKIRIEQIQNKIRFSITSPNGEMLELIEEDLSNFGKVVKGLMPIADFVKDPLQVLKFNQKMELLALELRMTKQLMQVAEKNIDSLEKDKVTLFALIDRSFSNIDNNQDIIRQLIEENQHNQYLLHALKDIRTELQKKQINSDVIVNALAQIQEASPKKARKVGEHIVNFFSGTAGGVLVEIIKQRFLSS